MEKITVQVEITERVMHGTTVEMTRAEYEEWCDRIDSARGFELEELTGELMDFARIDPRHGNVMDAEVSEFCEIKPKAGQA